jgi:hypothetical protein
VHRPSLIPGRASVGSPGYPPLTAAIFALDRIDFATGLHRLYYRRKSGAIACRTFVLDRFHGWLSHLNLSGARLSWALWVHHDVAGLAIQFPFPAVAGSSPSDAAEKRVPYGSTARRPPDVTKLLPSGNIIPSPDFVLSGEAFR